MDENTAILYLSIGITAGYVACLMWSAK